MQKILLAALAILTLACQPVKDKQPNILFIMSDDHTAQAWGIYGGILEPYVKNENIKYLASTGVVLNNAFCTNSICVPSRASILSGQYSHRNGVYDLNGSFSPDSFNVAKAFQNGGYETAIIGKWHLKNRPSGFDHYLVLPGQGRYDNPILKDAKHWDEGGEVYQGFSSDVIAQESINWLESRSKSDEPFLLFTHFKSTHEPFRYPARYEDYLEEVELPYPPGFEDWGKETTGRTHDGWPLEILKERFIHDTVNRYYPNPKFSVEGLNPLEARKATYQRFVKNFLRSGAAIDENIGKLRAYLKSTGKLENTIIVYTSDQGYFLGEHGFFDKRFIYEPSLRMPFVISYPQVLPQNTRVDELILNIDFPSTLLEFAQLPIPNTFQGKSFAGLIQDKATEWREDLYYRYFTNSIERPAHLGIRNKRYKLALFYGQSREQTSRDLPTFTPGWEFYDLEKDPYELHNAYHDQEYKAVIKEMKQRLKTLKKEVGDDDNNTAIQEIFELYWD